VGSLEWHLQAQSTQSEDKADHIPLTKIG